MDFFYDCRKLSDEVAIAMKPLVGTRNGAKVVGMGADGTPTTYIDKIAEDVILEYLHEIEANVIVISEEAGIVEITPGAEDIIYLDPVDGTFNAIANIPIYALSVAYASKGTVMKGFVSNLATGEIFTADKGKGTTKGGEYLNTSCITNLHEASCAVYTSWDEERVKQITPLLSSIRRNRHLGASALELAYVAAGRLEAYVDIRGTLRMTDAAAGLLLCTEAGGVVSSPDGNVLSFPDTIRSGASLIASNSYLHPKIVNAITRKNEEK
jgi:myo-inositol-1(or 4)-monophosphatase